MKQRLNALDVAACVNTLRLQLCGQRLANVYNTDANNKTYILKFSRPEGKAFLVIESGVRIHLTKFTQDKSQMPSVFTSKLRKHIRTKRLEHVRQLGTDRVVHFTFGSGDLANHLIIELFAKGNVVLTDSKGKILTLLRTYKYDEEYEVRVGNLYRFVDAAPMTQVSRETLMQSFAPERGERGKPTLVRTVNQQFAFGSQLVEHCVVLAGLDPKRNPFKEPLTDEEQSKLLKELTGGREIFDRLREGEETAKGFIVMRKEPEYEEQGELPEDATPAQRQEREESRHLAEIEQYCDFVPFRFEQLCDRALIEFDTFDESADEFFSSVALKKQMKEMGARGKQIDKKVAKAQQQQNTRLRKLKEKEARLEARAQLLEFNVDAADQAITIIRSGVAAGMNWDKLNDVVIMEQEAGNDIANLIERLDLANNSVVLTLSNPYDPNQDPDSVSVRIDETAYANARRLYEELKVTRQKREKTAEVSEQAIKRAMAHAERTVKVTRDKVTIQTLRKVHWWEKFDWFISSDGFLVIAGRDAQQNELIVKRYLRSNDVYVHAELHGASSCVVKGQPGVERIPDTTLAQAGYMTVCRSAAWKAKVTANAWWVHPDQVSKTAPAGEYLVTGSFMVRGKKNPLPAGPLTMGLGVMFRLGEASVSLRQQEKLKLEGEVIEQTVQEDEKEEDDADGDEEDDDSEEEELMDLGDSYKLTISSDATEERNRPRMSKAERKKQQKSGGSPPQKQQQQLPKKKKQAQKVRGKHGKKKKQQTKYRHQTEEERQEMLEILQSAGPTKEEESEEDSQDQEVAEGLEEYQEDDRLTRRGRAKDRQEVNAIIEEEKIALAEELMDGDERELAGLTGAPQPTDELLYAVIVCAPYSSLNGFKYRVKLLPADSVKKGKVAKNCMHQFLTNCGKPTEREETLISAIPDEELMRTLMANAQLQFGKKKKGGGGKKKGKPGARRHKGKNKRNNR